MSSATSSTGSQQTLFHVRVGTPLPTFGNGKDIAFPCIGDDGNTYYCKGDSRGLPLRAIEWTCHSLAKHVGLSVADYAIVANDNGETYFGSKSPKNVIAARFELENALRLAANDEVGRPVPWVGQYLSQLFAFDHFVCNPDRDTQNIILDKDNSPHLIRAIDFADAELLPFPVGKSLIETAPTVRVGKHLRAQYGTHKPIALEMLERIGAVPQSVIAGMLGQMPEDWLSEDQAGDFVEVWSDGRCEKRINELKTLIEHEW